MSPEPHDFSCILNAAHTGDLTYIKSYHNVHPDTHYSTIRYKTAGDTILHVSARLGHSHIVKYLLFNYVPCSVDCKSADQKTALHEAAQFARFLTARVLLQFGPDVNALKKGDWTPLMLACTTRKGCDEECYKIVQLLASRGALVNFKNKDGWTAAHLLAREGNLAIFNLLRKDYGLNVSARTNNGRTILHIAALHGHAEFLEVINALGDSELPLDVTDRCGNTAVHEACLGGHINVVKFLTSAEPDHINGLNKQGFNCLHLAAGTGHCDVAKLLLEDFKFDVHCTTTIGGLTPLHLAARRKLKDVYALLLNFEASEDKRDSMGRTALDYLQMTI